MKEFVIDALLVSLWASLLGNFWVLCLKDNMVFGKIGWKIRDRVECESGECENVKDLCLATKLLKGLECPFCVSIWMMIVMHILYYHLFVPESISWYLWVALILLEMGVTTLFNKIQTVFINCRLPF